MWFLMYYYNVLIDYIILKDSTAILKTKNIEFSFELTYPR